MNSPKKILLVDDVELNLELLEEIIKSFLPSSNIYRATSGLQAIEYYNKYKPDIVFMDIEIPELDGITAFSKIKESPNFNNIPFIGVSAGTEQSQIDRVLKSGMNYLLTKPIYPFKILEILNIFLNRKYND